MKLCWGNLEKIYLTKNGTFRKNGGSYIEKSGCKNCGEPYLSQTNKNEIFCSHSCSNSARIVNEFTRNKMSMTRKGRKFNELHKHNISKSCKNRTASEETRIKMSINSGRSKGGVVKDKVPLYNTYAHQLSFAEEVRPYYDEKGRNLLEVRCSKCREWFIPNIGSVKDRVSALNGIKRGERHLYCSQVCKDNCEIYGKNSLYYINLNKEEFLYTQEELSTWSQEVLSRANNKCEICGAKAEQAHHIQPKKLEPSLAIDPDNGLSLCKECHYKYGHSGVCSTGRLASIICKDRYNYKY